MSGDIVTVASEGIRSLDPYQPGKPESELRREYNLDRVVALAANENPLGPSPKALAAAQARLASSARYPDSGLELRQHLARLHDVEIESVVLGNGSNEVLELAAKVFLGPGREAIYSRHAFAVYGLATRANNATPRVSEPNPADHPMPYGQDLNAMAALVNGQTRLVFLANPNNPTGTWHTASELEAFLCALPSTTVAVVDEAYYEYAAGIADYPSAMSWVPCLPNVLVTRTFSKAQGLAGMRIGYGIAHPELAELLNRARQPFNINAPAMAAALAALEDQEHIAKSIALNNRNKRLLARVFDQWGCRYLPSAANFISVNLGRPGREIFEALLPRGIIVRPLAYYGLPDFVRITIGTDEEIELLIAALSQILDLDNPAAAVGDLQRDLV